MFNRGELVWGKIRSYPWWPAILLDAKDCGEDGTATNKWLFYFGDHKISAVKEEHIQNFADHFSSNTKKNKGKLFKKATQEALEVSAIRNKVEFKDTASLFQWASAGFKTNLSEPNERKNAVFSLPNFVEEALSQLLAKRNKRDGDNDNSLSRLQSKSKIRKTHRKSTTSSTNGLSRLQSKSKIRKTHRKSTTSSTNDDALHDVLHGFQQLEDICISCCERDVKLIAEHPLFIGSLCQKCKARVYKVCRFPVGRMSDFCIICGMGGDLVICSSSFCSRSFCKICIDYMASAGAYDEMVSNDNWLCCLCDIDHNIHCLIKRRKIYKAKAVEPLPKPKEKLPISVISLSNAGLNVLNRKKIKIAKYCIRPSAAERSFDLLDYSRHYKEFSKKEMIDISANLIIGSYIPSLNSTQNQKQWVSSFFLIFYRFLFRRDIARCVKLTVFFIFISQADKLTADVLDRVMRFLMVNPVTVNLKTRKFYVWSNVPVRSSRLELVLKTEMCLNDSLIEELILSKFIEPLKNYFQEA